MYVTKINGARGHEIEKVWEDLEGGNDGIVL